MLCDTAKDREFKFLNHIIVQIQIIGPEVTSYRNLNASVVIAVAFHRLTYRRGTPWFLQPAFYQPFQQWGLLPWPMPNTMTIIGFFHPNLSYFCQANLFLITQNHLEGFSAVLPCFTEVYFLSFSNSELHSFPYLSPSFPAYTVSSCTPTHFHLFFFSSLCCTLYSTFWSMTLQLTPIMQLSSELVKPTGILEDMGVLTRNSHQIRALDCKVHTTRLSVHLCL